MKTLIISVLIILTASMKAEESTDPRVQRWNEEQAASHARAMVKFSELLNDTKSGFEQHCDDEIALAEKNNDPILSKPDWPETIGERVVNKFFKGTAKSLVAEESNQKLLPVAKIPSGGLSGQWLYQNRLHKGTILKINTDNTKLYVISDWDNYGGQWQNVSDLDSRTRVWLDVATPAEKNAVAEADARQLQLAKESDAAIAAMNERLATQRRAEAQAQNEAEKMALQQEIARMLIEQNELIRQIR